ncbi:MAG: hypothetical protein ACOYL8_00530 [Patescibacteria group bacterium]
MSKEIDWGKIFWYIVGVVLICFWIWTLISGLSGNKGVKVGNHGCYEDKYGNETCYEDPRN